MLELYITILNICSFLFRERGYQSLILYELKKEVSSFLSGIDEKHLSQTLVEGYYVMLGSTPDGDFIVVALTSMLVTHYFKLKLPTS